MDLDRGLIGMSNVRRRIAAGPDRTIPLARAAGRVARQWLACTLMAMVVMPAAAQGQGTPSSGASTAHSTRPALVIVFDGSGSMWGKIDGARQAKFEIARDSLRAALSPLADRFQIGLVTFGARSRGACSSVDVAAGPGTVDGLAALEPLDDFNPQSRGPVVLGLETAMQTLKNFKGARDIVLIHDGTDNCGKSVCDSLAALQAAAPGVRISSVFLAPKPNQKTAMACLGKTGGRAISADTAEDTDAAIRQLASFIGQRAGPPARPGGGTRQAGPGREKQPPRKRADTPGLILTAVLVQDGQQLVQGLEWTVRPAGKTDDATAARSWRFRSARPSFRLEPGDYVVEARYGETLVRQDVRVEAGPRTIVEFNFNAASLTLTAALAAGQPALAGVLFAIQQLPDGGTAAESSAGKPVWQGATGGPPVLLPAGRYRVIARAGRLSRQRDIDLEAGAQRAIDFSLDAGQLNLSAAGSGDGDTPENEVMFTVSADDPTRASGRRIVARSAATRPRFFLPAGTYYVTATRGGMQAQELIAIAAGETVSREIQPRAMALTVRPRLKGGARVPGVATHTAIWRVEGKRRVFIGRSSAGEPTFQLPAGRYRVLSTLGKQNVRTVRDFTVGKERAGDLIIDHLAGTVALSIAGKAGRTGTDEAVYWKIFDSNGKIVFRSTDAEPQTVLPTGTYSVAAELRQVTMRDTVVITSGQHVDLKLGATQ